MPKTLLRTVILLSIIFGFQSASASTLSERPQNLGWGYPTALPWPDFSGQLNGFTLVATTTFTADTVSVWTCTNNGIVTPVFHVYKGNLDQLTEIASGTPTQSAQICPSNIFQLPGLLTSDTYKYTQPLNTPVTLAPGERLTVIIDSSPYHGYLVLGAQSTSTIASFVTQTSANSSAIIPFDPIYPYDPAFELNQSSTPCTINCNSNVLFLPGIEGSRLYQQQGSIDCSMMPPDTTPPEACFHENQLWEPNRDADVRKIFLDNEGKSDMNHDVYTRDIIDEVNVLPDPTGLLQDNIYKSFKNDLKNLKESEHLITDYSIVPYDWRLSLADILSSGKKEGENILYNKATTSPYIIQELRRLAASSRTGKVTIIAHSNGGLVTKALTNMLGTEASVLIDKIIFIAVPQVGTPAALAAALHGYDQDHLFGLITSKSTARTFASTSPMTYNLLPSAGYLKYVDSPVLSFDATTTPDWNARYGDFIRSPERLHNFLTDSYGRVDSQSLSTDEPIQLHDPLLTNAETLHADLDKWVPPAGIQLIQIAGWGIPKTVSGITYQRESKSFCDTNGVCSPPTSFFVPGINSTIDGDGTVVTPSALWTSTTKGAVNYWVDLAKYNGLINRIKKGRISSIDHSNILEVDELRDFIKENIITASRTNLPDFLSLQAPSSNDNRLRYSLHSPLTLDLYDDQGHHTGVSSTTGQIEEQIPGTYFTQFGEVKYLFTDASSTSHIVMNGYATGTFTFIAEQLQGDTLLASTTWKNIPTTPTTKVTLTTTGDITTISPMQIDNNSDGITDITLPPKQNDIVTLDTTPPEAVITFSTSTNAIAIQGIDDSGATTLSSTTTYPTLKKNQKQYNGIATTTVTIKDQAGNTTLLMYTEKLPSPERRDIINLISIAYNGATSSIPATLKYKWNTKQDGTYKLFASTFATSTVVIESHYRPKKNLTMIMQKPIDLSDNESDVEEGDEVDNRPVKTKLSGFVIPSLVTKHGKINVNY